MEVGENVMVTVEPDNIVSNDNTKLTEGRGPRMPLSADLS